VGSEDVDVREGAAGFDCDFREQYLFNGRVVGLDETDLLILVGVNPKTENPVLNARIRKARTVNGLEIALIGSS